MTPYVNYTFSYDDNLLRQHDRDAALARTGSSQMSDRSQLLLGGIRLDKTISQQRLTADVNLSRINYDHFSSLDHTSKNALGNWNWHAGNHLEGNLGSSYSKTLAPLEDFRSTEKNLRTQRRHYLDAAWLFHPSWRARAGVSHYNLDYSLATQRANERTQDTTEIGLDYLAHSKSTVGLRARQTRSRDAHAEDAGVSPFQTYDQNEFKGAVDWYVTEPTQLQFLGGWVQRNYDSSNATDFRGFNARLTARWQTTGKLGLTLAIWRELGSAEDLAASYALNRGIKLSTRWEMGSKLWLEGFATTEKRAYNGATSLAGSTGSGANVDRSDRYTKYLAGMTWLISQKLQFNFSIFREMLNSNLANLGYRDNGLQLSARYQF